MGAVQIIKNAAFRAVKLDDVGYRKRAAVKAMRQLFGEFVVDGFQVIGIELAVIDYGVILDTRFRQGFAEDAISLHATAPGLSCQIRQSFNGTVFSSDKPGAPFASRS